MVDQKLIDYINSSIKSGHSPYEVKTELLKQGWPAGEVSKAMDNFKGNGSTPPQGGGGSSSSGGGHKNIYLIGAIVVIVIIAITAFYVISLGAPPSDPDGRQDVTVCGDGLCEGDETSSNCPDDCAAPGPTTAGISVSPATKTVSNGETFTLDVTITGAQDLFGFQFDVEFDSSILEFVTWGEGGFLSNNGENNIFCVDHIVQDGFVKNMACTRLGRGSVEGDGVLQTLTFKAIGTGTSQVNLPKVLLANSKAEAINADVSNGEVTVS